MRPSSLGDIVHALALVGDVHEHRPELAVDWIAEDAFAPLVSLDRGIRRVIPVALRRWRHHPLDPATWREAAAFRRELRRDSYVACSTCRSKSRAHICRGLRAALVTDQIGRAFASRSRRSCIINITPSTRTSTSSTAAGNSQPLHWAIALSVPRASASRRRHLTRTRHFPSDLTSSCCMRRAAPTSCGRRRIGGL